MPEFETYQTNVGREQGGDRFFIKDGGSMVVEDGGNFSFNDSDFTAQNLRLQLLSQQTITNYVSLVSVLSVSVMSPIYGYAMFSLAAGCSKASIKLPSAELGATLLLNFSGLVSNAVVSLFAASAGGNASLDGLQGSDLSGLYVSHGAIVKMVCATAGLWTVVDRSSSVTELPST